MDSDSKCSFVHAAPCPVCMHVNVLLLRCAHRPLSTNTVHQAPTPGGSVQFQSLSLGLAEQWDAVKEAYAAANRALGNIVKVTPSSKVVGDLANFMVSNGLDEHSLVERAGDLSFPTSVVEFMQARRSPCGHA
jgi:pyruvate carboxylase